MAIYQPNRALCPMCDNRGFKRVIDNFSRRPVFRCNYCHHEWEGYGAYTPSDKRKTIHEPREYHDD